MNYCSLSRLVAQRHSPIWKSAALNLVCLDHLMHRPVSYLSLMFRVVLLLYLQSSAHCTQMACSNFNMSYALVSSSFLDHQSFFLRSKLIVLATQISKASIMETTCMAWETSFITILVSSFVVSILAHLALKVLEGCLIIQVKENTWFRSEAFKPSLCSLKQVQLSYCLNCYLMVARWLSHFAIKYHLS